jgi:hypothetical protein
MKRALVRALAIGTSVSALCVGVVGFAHTSMGRPLLGAVTRVAHGGCPFGYDKPMTPAERERAELHFAASHRGALRALSRPALGFVLDRTTRGEVEAKLEKQGIRCSAGKGLSDLTCEGVPSAALGGVPAPKRDLWLTFGSREQLLSVIAISRASDPVAISGAFVATERELGDAAGAASQTRGDANPVALASGSLRQASAEFRFADYYAVTRATNIGKSFVLTEEYRSLPD